MQSAIAELRRDLEAVREVTSAAEADDVLAFEGLKDLDGRLRAVETLPERVEKVFRELSRASGDAITHQQGLLHEAVGQAPRGRVPLEAVEWLPADLEGLYAALFRVAESVKALGSGRTRSRVWRTGPAGGWRGQCAGDLVERAGRKLAGGDHGVAVQPVGDGLALGPPGKDHRRRRFVGLTH